MFQDNDNVLAGYNSSGSNFTTTAGMRVGTSPSIAAKSDGTYEIAVEANTSDLATVHLGTGYTGHRRHQRQGRQPGTARPQPRRRSRPGLRPPRATCRPPAGMSPPC